MYDLLVSRYTAALVRSWRWIVATAVVAAAVAGLVAALQPRTFTATVEVVPQRARTEVNYDTRIRTLSADNAGQPQTGQASPALPAISPERRQALAQLVTNADIEQAVRDELGNDLPAQLRAPGRLLSLVQGKVVPRSEIITISVTGSDGPLVERLAGAWGRAYERRVNELYAAPNGTSSVSQMDAEVAAAKGKYDMAEQALTQFVINSEQQELDRRSAGNIEVLTLLYQTRRNVATEGLKRQQETIATAIQRLSAVQVDGLTLAISKEQEAKVKEFTAFVDAQTAAMQSVFTEQAQNKVKTLTDLYERRRRIEGVFADASALRQQIGGTAAEPGPGTATAMTLLKTRAFAVSAGLPNNMQLQLPVDSAGVGPTIGAQRQDLDATLTALVDWHKRVDGEIDAQQRDLLSGQYAFLQAPSGSSPLAQTIKKKYAELFQLGELSRLTNDPRSGTEVEQLVIKLTGDLTQLAVQTAFAAVQGDPRYNQAISELEASQRAVQGRLAELGAQAKNLTLERDLRWESYTSIRKKSEEGRMAAVIGTGKEVSIASQAVIAAARSRGLPLWTAFGALLGLALAGSWFAGREYVRALRERHLAESNGQIESGTNGTTGALHEIAQATR